MAYVDNLLKKDYRSNGYYDQSYRIDGQMFLIFVRICRISLFFQIVHLGSQVASPGGFKRTLQLVIVKWNTWLDVLHHFRVPNLIIMLDKLCFLIFIKLFLVVLKFQSDVDQWHKLCFLIFVTFFLVVLKNQSDVDQWHNYILQQEKEQKKFKDQFRGKKRSRLFWNR